MLNFEDDVPMLGLRGVSTAFMPGGARHLLAQTVGQSLPVESFLRVKLDDKRVINGKADVNPLVPFKYKWTGEK